MSRIKMFNAPELKVKCEEVTEIDKAVLGICVDMLDTFNKNAKKVDGLAANQLGYTKRIIVVRDIRKDVPEIYINPVIEEYSKQVFTAREGCASYPTLFKPIARPVSCRISAMTVTGEKVTFIAEGWQARIFFHEIDHLNGICKVGMKK